MKENFDLAFKTTVGLEGGYTNDPDDPGGETKFGIAKKYHPNVDIKNLTLEQAKEIYRKEYWNKINGDTLPAPMDIIGFDRSVLFGTPDVRQWLKEADEAEDLLFFSIQHIVDHWNPKYAKGWLNRILYLWKHFCK